jgi:hypothetical protein
LQKAIIVTGLIILVIGLFWPWLSKIPFGRLPGDIVVQKENSVFFFPLTTMILLSIVISLLAYWFKK